MVISQADRYLSPVSVPLASPNHYSLCHKTSKILKRGAFPFQLGMEVLL